MADLTWQAGFAAWGIADEVAGGIPENITALLQDEPDCRNDNNLLVVRYLVRYGGLSNREANAVLLAVKRAHVSFKTLLNRAMEVQKDTPEVAPSPDVRAARDVKARRGPVR